MGIFDKLFRRNHENNTVKEQQSYVPNVYSIPRQDGSNLIIRVARNEKGENLSNQVDCGNNRYQVWEYIVEIPEYQILGVPIHADFPPEDLNDPAKAEFIANAVLPMQRIFTSLEQYDGYVGGIAERDDGQLIKTRIGPLVEKYAEQGKTKQAKREADRAKREAEAEAAARREAEFRGIPRAMIDEYVKMSPEGRDAYYKSLTGEYSYGQYGGAERLDRNNSDSRNSGSRNTGEGR